MKASSMNFLKFFNTRHFSYPVVKILSIEIALLNNEIGPQWGVHPTLGTTGLHVVCKELIIHTYRQDHIS